MILRLTVSHLVVIDSLFLLMDDRKWIGSVSNSHLPRADAACRVKVQARRVKVLQRVKV